MTLPTVNKDESRLDFGDRCMIDAEMTAKFPNEGQRVDAITEIYESVLTDELVTKFNEYAEVKPAEVKSTE